MPDSGTSFVTASASGSERSRAALCALPVHLFLSKYFNVLGRKVFGAVSMDIVVCGRGSIFVFIFVRRRGGVFFVFVEEKYNMC